MKIYDSQGNAIFSTEKSCNKCTSITLFALVAGASPLVPGSYSISARFDKGQGVTNTANSTFTISSGQTSGSMPLSFAAVFALVVVIAARSELGAADGTNSPRSRR